MKTTKVVLRRREEIGRIMEVVNLTKYMVSMYVNITMYVPIQLLYAKNILK
jgi:hypothetical protein